MKKDFKLKYLIIILIAIAPLSALASGRLFKSEDKLSLTIEAPFNTIYRERDKAKVYSNGKLYYKNKEGQNQVLSIGLKVRGNFRLQKKNCTNPPLKVLFNKGDIKGSIFNKQMALKLVSPCKNKMKYQELIMLEYLTYKMYNLLTPQSYKVRLAEIKFVDTEGRVRERRHLGFFIESNKGLGKRIKKPKLSVSKIRLSQLEPRSLAMQNLFQYMIANTDFSTLTGPKGDDCCHNAKLFKNTGDRFITAIPYDFDSTGLVDAPYAAPSRAVKISSVRTRRYRGFCEQNNQLKSVIPLFNVNRKAIEALFVDNEGLNAATEAKTIRYLDKFYQIINNPQQLQKKVLKNCR